MTACTVLDAEVHGLRVVAARIPWVHTSVAAVDVLAGYADDPPGKAGLAHLTEHVCTASAASRYGVAVAARTEPAATRYSARDARAEPLVRAMVLPFTAEAHGSDLHEAETMAVLTENARLRDQPQLGLAMAVASRAFPWQDTSVPDVTTEESLRSVTPDDVLDFRRRRYDPRCAVLCVVGPHEPDGVLDLVGSALVSGERCQSTIYHSRPSAGRPAPAVGDLTDCVVWTACTLAGHTDQDLAARTVAVELLVGPSGLLDEVAGRSTGFAALPGRRREVLVVAWPPADLVAALRRAAPRPALIALARDRVRTRTAFEQQTPGGLAQQLLRHATGNGPWPSLATVDRLTTAAVADAVDAILRTATVWRIADGTLTRIEEGP